MPGVSGGKDMMYLIVGENGYRRAEALAAITAKVSLTPEKYDGAELTEGQLADCIAGATLFSSKRLVVINELSSNKSLWEKCAEWVARVSEDTELVLIDAKPDRRTKAYKALAKAGTVITAEQWTERDIGTAAAWVGKRAKELKIRLTDTQIAQMVSRATLAADRPGAFVIDQQVLGNALEALGLVDAVTDDTIMAVLPESSTENVFELLEAALRKDTERVKGMLSKLHMSADPYMVFGLITSQWSQLVALKLSGETPDTLAREIEVSPYVLRKLAAYAARFDMEQVSDYTKLLAGLDVRLKTTGLEPWVAADRFIAALAT